MASFDFYTTNAAAQNTAAARLRESTRMACIAHGLKRLGHDVHIVSAWDGFKDSNRWKFFADLWSDFSNPHAYTVRPAEELRKADSSCDVAIKCSVNTGFDQQYVAKAQVVVAHEYADAVASHPALLPVPFLVHDRVIADWCGNKDDRLLMRMYLDDDVYMLRLACAKCLDENYVPPPGDIAFAGMGHYGRKDVLSKMEAEFPGRCDFITKDTPGMGGDDYMLWLGTHQFALIPHGDTPKTNRWSEAALLGLAIISPEQHTKVIPPQTSENTIMPSDWDDVETIKEGMGRCESIVEAATRDYLAGWSPTGQARLICQRLGLDAELNTEKESD